MKSDLLHNRALWTLGFAESVSSIGNWITMMAIFSLVVFTGEGTVLQSSGIFVAGLLPTLVVSPIAGWLCDRFDLKWLMVGSELLSGLIVSGLIFAERLWLIYALIVLQAISLSIMTPARQATVPALVSKSKLTRANAFLQQLAGLTKIGAPMLAGALLSVVSAHTAIILDVLSFVFSAYILARLPTLRPGSEASPQGATALDQEKAGTPASALTSVQSILRAVPTLRLLFVLTFVAILVIIGYDALSAVYVRDVLHGDEGTLGTLIGLVGLGTLGTSVVLMTRKRESEPWRDMLLGFLLLALLPAALAICSRFDDASVAGAIAAVGCLVGGMGNGLLTVQGATLLQMLAPEGWLGRLGGVFQSTLVAGQIVGLIATPLLVPSLLPIETFFALAAIVIVTMVALAGWYLARHKTDWQASSAINPQRL